MSVVTYTVGLVSGGNISKLGSDGGYYAKFLWVNMVFPFVGATLASFAFRVNLMWDRDENKKQ